MRKIFLPAAVLALFSLSSCMSVSKYVRKAKKDLSIVPADFNPQKHVLLFAEMPRLNKPSQRNDAVTKKLDKALKKYCPYKYEIVSPKDIMDTKGKYSDTSVYKYAVMNSLNSSWHSTTTTTTISDNMGTRSSSVSPSARSTSVDFHFYDRTAQKSYPNSGNATSLMNYTVAAFMDVIKKAKGQ